MVEERAVRILLECILVVYVSDYCHEWHISTSDFCSEGKWQQLKYFHMESVGIIKERLLVSRSVFQV